MRQTGSDSVGQRLRDRRTAGLVDDSGSVAAGHAITGADYRFYGSNEPIVPYVSETQRSRFVESFKSYDLGDLSVICTRSVPELES